MVPAWSLSLSAYSLSLISLPLLSSLLAAPIPRSSSARSPCPRCLGRSIYPLAYARGYHPLAYARGYHPLAYARGYHPLAHARGYKGYRLQAGSYTCEVFSHPVPVFSVPLWLDLSTRLPRAVDGPGFLVPSVPLVAVPVRMPVLVITAPGDWFDGLTAGGAVRRKATKIKPPAPSINSGR